MKNLYIFLFYILFVNSSCSAYNNQKNENFYEINKIDHINSYYFIYCEKDGRKYKIISKQINNKLNAKQIVIGNSYQFQLQDFPEYSKETNPLGGFISMLTCFYLDENTKVCEEIGISLRTTKNLKGLYYIK